MKAAGIMNQNFTVLPSDGSSTTIESASEMVPSIQRQSEHESHDSKTQESTDTVPGEEMEGSSNSDGRREETLLLAGFDILRFKNNFLEMVEELRLQRTFRAESEKHIEKLLVDKHELAQKLDEAASLNAASTEAHACRVQEMNKKHEEELLQYRNDQAKGKASQESRDKELKALKDEMRALHLTKHVLEKKVQEQERQIQLQSSSRESYLNKMTQLEEKFTYLFKMADDTNEHIGTLEANVKQARELHHKLEYVNKHQNCELEQVRQKLDNCRQKLIESRVQRADTDSKEEEKAKSMTAKHKTTEQELKMQVELCKHLQAQLSSLREEHQGVLNQLKEAHVLLERHVENSARAMDDEGELRRKLDGLKSEVKSLKERSSLAEESNRIMKEKHKLEKEALDMKILDIEHRLVTLQSDYKLLQDSYDCLETSKSVLKKDHETEMEGLRMKSTHLEKEMADASKEFESREYGLRDKLEKLQSALDQSELELVIFEEKLQEKDKLITDLMRRVTIEQHGIKILVDKVNLDVKQLSFTHDSPQFSPEVITSLNEDITPDLIIQQTPRATPPPPISNELLQVDTTTEAVLTSPPQPSQSPANDCSERNLPEEVPADLQPPNSKRPRLEEDSLPVAGLNVNETEPNQQVARTQCSPCTQQTHTDGDSGPCQNGVLNELEQQLQQDIVIVSKERDGDSGHTKFNLVEETVPEGKESHTRSLLTSEVADIVERGGEILPEVMEGGPSLKEGEGGMCLQLGGKEISPEIAEGGPDGEGGVCLQFSPEFGKEGEGNMLSTQMNQQIERVEVFLKKDRLRRQKPLTKS